MRTHLKVPMIVLGLALATVDAQAQSTQQSNLGQVVSGLINVNVGEVAVNVGDITLNDLVDINDVLNNNHIQVLDNILNHSPILSGNSDILTHLLQDANLLNDNQVVVGVLSGLFVIQTLP